jgi:deoxycytidylate deaminase
MCSNTKEQMRIVEELVEHIEREFNNTNETLQADVKRALLVSLRKSRVGGLLEFSRAVHAEMDALLAAARSGVSPVGGRLYVTTFPCHYCARHIVASGVIEVQYIEPYPKSLATRLHDDSICTTESERAEKVLFRPFSGVAPRLYRRAFMKDRPLKDKRTGNISIGVPAWGTPWHLRRVSYVKLEAELAEREHHGA